MKILIFPKKIYDGLGFGIGFIYDKDPFIGLVLLIVNWEIKIGLEW